MLDYLRSISLDPISIGSGNYSPQVAIVVDNNTYETYELKNKIRASGIDPEDLWITPLIKSKSLPEELLVTYLGIELKRLNPKQVILFCVDNVVFKDKLIDTLKNNNLNKYFQMYLFLNELLIQIYYLLQFLVCQTLLIVFYY